MADQIKKIIFTTKESYDQKVAAGTLEQDVIYTIDASQAVTPTEVKTAVDNGFDKFGLTLGIDKDKAEFYKFPIALADMISDIVKDKIDANYNNDSRVLVTSDRTVSFNNVYRNTVITVKQNGTDFGMIKYTLNPTVEEDANEGTTRIATITLPEALDLTKEFDVILANVFGTKTNTINFTPTFEKIVENRIDEFMTRTNFDTAPFVYSNDILFGTVGNWDFGIKYFQNNDSAKENFRNNVNNIIDGFNVHWVAIPDKSLIDSTVVTALKNSLTQYGSYVLITDLELNEYYDSVKEVWAPMPSSKNESLTKLREFTNYNFHSEAINNTKVNDVISKLNISSINTSSRYSVNNDTIDSEEEAKLRAADIISYTNLNPNEFVDTLISLNNTTPLTTKAIYLLREISQDSINKLATIGSLQVVVISISRGEYITIPEGFKPLIYNYLERKVYVEIVKGKIASYVEVPDSIKDTIKNIR